MKTVKRIGFPFLLLCVCLACAAVLLLTGQQTAGDDSWRQLSLPAFVQEIEQLTSAPEPVSAEQWTDIRSQSAERLLSAIENSTAADYSDLVSLYLWSKPNLSAEQNETVLAGLTPQANQVSPWPFEKVKAVYSRMTEAEMPTSSIEALPLSWLEGRNVQTLDDVDQLAWLFERVHTVGRSDSAANEFTAVWTGSVQAPSDGQYTFSVSPVELDFEHGNAFRTQTLSVSVGGQKILDTSGQEAPTESSLVTLSAAQKTPVRVELSYVCSDGSAFTASPAVATLYWQGAGMSKRLVPQGALFTADGQSGLDAKYVLKIGEQDQTINRVDSQLDFVWYHGSQIAPAHEDLRKDLGDQLFTVASSPSTLARWESEESAQGEDWPGANWALLESLDAARQQQWAETLLAHPVLLEDCDRQAAMDLYRHCRFGALGESLQLFGLWAQGHADQGPALAPDFYRANRLPYRKITHSMVWQYRAHLDQLEEDFLVMPDGGCSLPVAYTLSYGYWVEKRISDWIDKLEARLADEQLTGDRRVGWLLARAQAEEIRHGRPGRYWKSMEHALAGAGWIEEATLVAESEAVRLGAFEQLAARFTTNERLDAARRILDQAQARCASGASTELLTQWRGTLDALGLAFQERHDQHEAAAREAYVQRLRKRHQTALGKGDSQATSRYEQLLSDAGASAE